MSKDIEYHREKCTKHPDEFRCKYCSTCSTAICLVCEASDHSSGCEVENLGVLTSEKQQVVKQLEVAADSVEKLLEKLRDDVDPTLASLEKYVDDELGMLRDEIMDKKKELHSEVDERAARMRITIGAEIEACEKELESLRTGQRVLDAISNQEGVVPGSLGKLIHGKLDYAEFISEVDAPLHPPPRMQQLLGLQLPMQSLQEMCDLMTWTPLSLSFAPKIFPSEGMTASRSGVSPATSPQRPHA